MRLFPRGAWFGLTRLRLRLIGIALAIPLSLCFLAWGGARLALEIEAWRAASLLEDLRRIQVGQPEASVSPTLLRYEDREWSRRVDVEGNTHFFTVDPWHFHRSFVRWAWLDNAIREAVWESGGVRRCLGLRVWDVRASLESEDGKVQAVRANLVVEGENEWLMADWHYTGEVPAEVTRMDRQHGTFRPEMKWYVAHWSHLHLGPETGEVLYNSVSASAAAEALSAAREINLNCLTSSKGCRSLCELMPAATRYRHEHDYPGLGWNSGSWGEQDRSCE